MATDPDEAAALDAALTDDQGEGVLLRLKVLAVDALPAALLTDGPPPKVAGVVMEVRCPPGMAVDVLRRCADAIEREAAADALLDTMRN